MPQRRASAEQRAIAVESRFQVVQQRLDRAQVKQAEPVPVLAQHPRHRGKERRFGLASRRRRQHDHVLTAQDRLDHGFLERPEVTPTETVDDVVPQGRMELIEPAQRSNSMSSTPVAALA